MSCCNDSYTRQLTRQTAKIVLFLLADWIDEKVLLSAGVGRVAQKAIALDVNEARALLSDLEELL